MRLILGLSLIFVLVLSLTSCGDASAIDQIERYVPPTSTPTVYQQSVTPTPTPQHIASVLPSPSVVAVVPTAIPTSISAPSVVPTFTQEPSISSVTSPVPTATLEPTHTPEASTTSEPSLAGYDEIGNGEWISWAHPAETRRILSFPWASDGLSDFEKRLVNVLVNTAVADIEYLKAILELPFLESLETHDLHAANALRDLVRNEALAKVLSHRRLLEADEETWAAMVVAAGITEPQNVTHLLDTATVESGAAPTHLTDDMRVSIIRSDRSQPGSLDLVFEAASFVEKTMAMPFPTDHIMVTLDDGIDFGDHAAGFYNGYAMAYRPQYEDLLDDFEYRAFTTGIIHELAHYFWHVGASWLVEGMANIHEYLYLLDQGMSRAQLKHRRGDCEAHDLAMLTEWFGFYTYEGRKCNYFMGETLFQALLHETDRDHFLTKVRELYRLSESEKANGHEVGIKQVRQVFQEQIAVVERYWDGDWNAPENRDMTEGIERESHLLVQWHKPPVFDPDTKMVSFSGILYGEAVLHSPHISIAREDASNFRVRPFDSREWAGTILPYLEDGSSWVLDDSPSTVATIYDVGKQSFRVEFPFSEKLGTPTDYVVVVSGFQSNRRVPTIGSETDNIGYARIRNGAGHEVGQASEATSTPVPSPTATPTPVPSPTAIPTAAICETAADPPEHMAYIWWSWNDHDREGYKELEVEFTIHNDPEPFPSEDRNGLYMILGIGRIAGTQFYFGIQTDVWSTNPPYQGLGKGIIYSRWDEHDLAYARWDEKDGFAQSSGGEGGFIGVRRLYEWGVGDYRAWIAPEANETSDGWYGLWIEDLQTDTTTWAGSLRFPGGDKIVGQGYSAMEVYGDALCTTDIPEWHVSIERPTADGVRAVEGVTGYAMFTGELLPNSDIRYSSEDNSVHFRAGGTTERAGSAGAVSFEY